MNNNEKVLRIAKEIPGEIRSVIKGLNDDARLAILLLLMKNDKMTFTELKNSLNLNSSSLSADLSLLQDGGLIANFLEWKNKSYSYYVYTDLAKSVLRSLFDTVVKLPDEPKQVSALDQQVTKDRHRYEIISTILNITLTGQNRRQIKYKAFLSSEQLTDYLEALEKSGLIVSNESTKLYETTEIGLKFLDNYKALLSLRAESLGMKDEDIIKVKR
jgi:predicted transcriptional regulator